MEKIEISHKTIIFTVFFLIFLWFLYSIRHIILIVFIGLVAMFALNPLIDRLERVKIPRPLAVLSFYFLMISFIIGVVVSIIPVVVNQSAMLIELLPNLVKRLDFLGVQFQLSDYSDQLLKLPGNFLKIVALTFSNIVRFFAFIVITYYLLMERKNMKKYLHVLFRREGEKRAEILVAKLEEKIGGWVRGQLVLMFIVGFMSFVGLSFLGLEFAIPLAVLAGLLEIIPNIGPTVAAIPSAIIGLSISPVMGLTVVALYFVIQQLENNIIVPKVMQKSVGLPPLVTLILLMVGLTLGGIGGAILAIPIFLTIQIIVKDLYSYYRSS